jgi:hypothetical protein
MALSKKEKIAIENEVYKLASKYNEKVQESFYKLNARYGIPIYEIRDYWIKIEKQFFGPK